MGNGRLSWCYISRLDGRDSDLSDLCRFKRKAEGIVGTTKEDVYTT